MAAEHHGRLEYCPKRHQCVLLVPREIGHSGISSFGPDPDVTERQHVSVRIRAGRPPFIPAVKYFKMLFQLLPAVPKIADGTPHVRVILNVLRMSDRGFARR